MCIEMFRTRIMLFGTAFVVWLCCSHLFGGADGQVTDPVEVTALHTFKQSLIDRNQNLSNWNHGDPCMSNWTGVLCFNMIMDDGYLHVEELLLQNMNLSGSLSPELHRLSYMKRLLLSGNQLTGSLPEEIGYLPNLDRIQIDQNQISGPIPKSFANLNKTKHFHMNNNSISGQILLNCLVSQNLFTCYLTITTYQADLSSSKSGISKVALIGIALGTIAVSKISSNIDGVKGFTYREMALATDNFHASTQVGQGGYGNVYKGILADGTVVAIKRAQEGSLQGEKEFLTEIELLSRLHHRNLVSLIDTVMKKVSLKAPMSFAMRLKIALAAAKGILYLHMEANPPIFHRDIKASNILLILNLLQRLLILDFHGLPPSLILKELYLLMYPQSLRDSRFSEISSSGLFRHGEETCKVLSPDQEQALPKSRYCRGVPDPKIRIYDVGMKRKESMSFFVCIWSAGRRRMSPVRHWKLHVLCNKYMTKFAGKDAFHLRVRVLLSVRCKDGNSHHAQEALRRAKFKFPGRQKIIVSRKWGFTKYNRTDYLRWKSENRIVSDGVNAKLLGCHGPSGKPSTWKSIY
ncbi:60S ribosomal protein L10 [Camellia lanceoleosa]|uniref:60S ribosomal protein L10 n=1 Tax=Camellia lanceoleosa TaxID=1840588 RepID=A0ACC0HNX0_9ERIC|nr:60S ribosomal protein L10 [Camellia lanceoleosa]